MNVAPLWHPDVARDSFAHVLFRRVFETRESLAPARFFVSAAQRFELYLDGRLLARGPARSTNDAWGCVTITLPRLDAGRHVLGARVIQFAEYAGKGQLGGPAFFLLTSGNRTLATAAGTDQPWRCRLDKSRRPLPERAGGKTRQHCAVGAGERFIARDYAWNWHSLTYDDSAWTTAQPLCDRLANPWGNRRLQHSLRPESLPPMRNTPVTFVVRRADRPAGALARGEPLSFPPQCAHTVILDCRRIVNAWITIAWSGGRDATIRIISCEAPVDRKTGDKGNRDKIDNCSFPGLLDEIIADGGAARSFTPAWFRSFRYLILEIKTAGHRLTIDRLELLNTSFPLTDKSRIVLHDPAGLEWERFRQIGLRTLLLCSHETFFDCPHYEQSQFPGDSRIMARAHYLRGNDDRLVRKAIDDLHNGWTPTGLIRSHYPASFHQVIATWALQWIGMLHDFRVYRGDAAFLRTYLAMARAILDWFENHIRPDGLLGRIEYPLFFDWTPRFPAGCAPQDTDGGSCPATALYAQACDWMAGLEAFAGIAESTPHWRRRAQNARRAIRRRCWNEQRGLFADTPAHNSFSVHAQVQAILAGCPAGTTARQTLDAAIDAPDVTQPGTLYYWAAVLEAARLAGAGHRYFSIVKRWFQLLQGTGLTTWPESDKPRSDCHGWGLGAENELIHTVVGLSPDPAVAGFERAILDPNPGPISTLAADLPLPAGNLQIKLRQTTQTIDVDLLTPIEIFVPATAQTLDPGSHRFALPGKTKSGPARQTQSPSPKS